jgi:hypothetical protein
MPLSLLIKRKKAEQSPRIMYLTPPGTLIDDARYSPPFKRLQSNQIL